MLPKLVMFDYGETLAHEEHYSTRRGFAGILPYACENPESAGADTLYARYRDAYEELRQQGQRIGVEIPNAARWRWVCDMLDIRFSLPTAELEELFWDAAAPCTPTPGMPRLLALLREKGIRTGVISNMGFSGAALARRLQKTFPEHRFDFVISSADYILRKPDPHIFALGLHRAGCRAEEAWFLGDNLRCDILGAASAGILPVYYALDLGDAYREPQDVDALPAHLVIRDWDELIRLILNGGIDAGALTGAGV